MDSIKGRAGLDQRINDLGVRSAIDLKAELEGLLAALDASGETMAATYVQMAIDVLSNDGAGDNT